MAWANEQARLIRAERVELLDLEHIAEEIEDVGKSEQRELANRMAVLLAHLFQWHYQPERRCASWDRTAQRTEIAYGLKDTPSLMPTLKEAQWLDRVWDIAVAQAAAETGLDCFPEVCPWAMDDVLRKDGVP